MTESQLQVFFTELEKYTITHDGVDALLDDFNSSSCQGFVIYKQEANVRSLRAAINRFFNGAFTSIIEPEIEHDPDSMRYRIEFDYAQIPEDEMDTQFIAVANDPYCDEKKYIKKRDSKVVTTCHVAVDEGAPVARVSKAFSRLDDAEAYLAGETRPRTIIRQRKKGKNSPELQPLYPWLARNRELENWTVHRVLSRLSSSFEGDGDVIALSASAGHYRNVYIVQAQYRGSDITECLAWDQDRQKFVKIYANPVSGLMLGESTNIKFDFSGHVVRWKFPDDEEWRTQDG